MKRRFIQLLIAFAVANIIGILVFYGWVVSNQIRPRTSDLTPNIIISSDSVTKLRERPRTEAQKYPEVKRTLFTGHTLKPPSKRKPVPEWIAPERIPPVPEVSASDDVAPIDEDILKKYQAYDPVKTNESILILSPIHNVEGKLKGYLHLLQSINYPHHLISIAFGEDSSHDNTLHVADNIAVELRKSFAQVEVFHFNLTGQIDGTWNTVHHKNNQFHRRRHLAQARNALLRAGLKNQKWVLWIDSDVSFFSPDIIQQLLSAQQDIVAPLCIYMDSGRKRVFDKNTWRETQKSLSELKHLPPDELVVEGYSPTKRLWLSDLRAEGRVVPIDGVGGCTLLIHSKCHRDGLNFPENLFQNHIETEGLAKLAKKMGYGVYGMPYVEIIH